MVLDRKKKADEKSYIEGMVKEQVGDPFGTFASFCVCLVETRLSPTLEDPHNWEINRNRDRSPQAFGLK